MTLTYDQQHQTFQLDGTPCAVKHTRAGRIAVRRHGQWHYFGWDGSSAQPARYELTGSTLRLDHR